MSNVCTQELKFSANITATSLEQLPEPFEPSETLPRMMENARPEGNYDYSEKALKCQFSRKDFRNNSVFCNRLDQWVALNNCESACRKGVFP